MHEYSVNPIIPTKFVDYTFSLTSDGSIVWDEALTPEHLAVREGDRFEVVFVPGNVVFKRLEGITSKISS